VPDDDDPHRRAGQQPDPVRRRVLGEAIKEARITRHCKSQARFATAAGISERSVAGAEAGEYVGRTVLAAIENALSWPARKTTDYLFGDDEALKALPARGPDIPSAPSKRLAGTDLTMDIAPAPDSVEWWRDLQARVPNEQFLQIIAQTKSRPPNETA
jgi:transcriptional regulator with XRE-family HTH domain